MGTATVQAVDPATDTAGSAIATLASDGQVVTRNITLSAWTHLEGTVFRADGTTPVPAARVSILVPGAGYFTTTADVDGKFRFLYLPLGAFTIDAQDVAGTGSVGRVTGTLTTPGGTVTQNVTLLAQGSLVVTVRDGNGALAEGAQVVVSVQNGQLGQSRSGRTNADGLAIFQDLIAGTYGVYATKGSLQAPLQTGTIQAGATAQASLQLQATGALVGTVFLPDGQTPATNVQVSLYSVLYSYLPGDAGRRERRLQDRRATGAVVPVHGLRVRRGQAPARTLEPDGARHGGRRSARRHHARRRGHRARATAQRRRIARRQPDGAGARARSGVR